MLNPRPAVSPLSPQSVGAVQVSVTPVSPQSSASAAEVIPPKVGTAPTPSEALCAAESVVQLPFTARTT